MYLWIIIIGIMIGRMYRKMKMLIITMLSAILTTLLHHHQVSGKGLKDIPSHYPEHPYEESFYRDYIELNRDKTTAAASGTSTILSFGKNNSNSQPYRL